MGLNLLTGNFFIMTNDRKETYKEHSVNLHHEGYRCAQCVLMTLSNLIGLDRETAARIASGMGGGVGGCGEICGAANAMAMAESFLHEATPSDNRRASADVKPLVRRFAAENSDRLACRDLKGKPDAKSCDELIALAVDIFISAHPELISQES